MRGNSGGKCFGIVTMSLRGKTKGVYIHISTPDAQVSRGSEKKCVKSVETTNYILRVKLSHPYIDLCENNRLQDMRTVRGHMHED